ncbi:hypothetical protein BRD17_07135 [Halobacteriales archaeon SW_7_68_16]|nr:MAG: hypothetical protein BRD17_07135 [Halobacteriales archaeon SW_7_68_16]
MAGCALRGDRGLSRRAGRGRRRAAATGRESVETDRVRLSASVDPSGTAQWRVQYLTLLDDENTTAAFRSLQADVEDDPTAYTTRFEERIRRTVLAAGNTTGREMTVTNVTVTTEIRSLPNRYGAVVYTFEWGSFARVENRSLLVGDAIEGFFLSDDSRLMVRWPDGYRAASIRPDSDGERENAAIWRGSETEFVDGEPRLELVPAAPPTAAPAPDDDGSDGGPAGEIGDGTGGAMLALGGVAFVSLSLVAGAMVLRARRDGTVADTENTDPDGGTDTATASDAGDGGEADRNEGKRINEELLSNEERVLRVVRDRGGRVKQQEVVTSLGWTDAKTSQVVGTLRDGGRLDSFRLGRENVLVLPEEDDRDI